MSVLFSVGLTLFVCALAARLTGRIKEHVDYGICAVGWGCFAIDAFGSDYPIFAIVNAAGCAWCAYRWWKSGGGDGTRRRLHSLRERFSPVRRTAPAGA